MIDNYLKTSMPVYDSIDRQNHRDECCKNEQFKLYTDPNHLPPFQIYIPDFIATAPVFVSWRHAEDDTFFAGPTVPFSVYSDGTNSWVIYEGIAVGAAIPEGQYYIQIRVDPGAILFWTEVFTVCDCDLIPGIYGDELLVNGDFTNWAGGNPTGWIVAEAPPDPEITEVAPGVGHGGGGNGACNWFTTGNAVFIRQDVMTQYRLYEFNGDITNVVLGQILATFGTGGGPNMLAVGANTVIDSASDVDFRVVRDGACDVTGDNFSLKEVEIWTMCNHLSLTWWSECDFDGIIYQFGYRNRLILEAVLISPRAEIEKQSKKRIDTLFYEWISHKEFYGIKIVLSKYAFYALSRLPLYADNEFGHVILTLPNGDTAEIYEMTIDATWQTDNCYAEFSLDFIQGELVITNCCVDLDVSEQIAPI